MIGGLKSLYVVEMLKVWISSELNLPKVEIHRNQFKKPWINLSQFTGFCTKQEQRFL